MRLVTFELAAPLGTARRLGLWRSPQMLDLNLAYAGWVSREADAGFARRLAEAVLPPDLLGLWQAGARGQAALQEVAAAATSRRIRPGTTVPATPHSRRRCSRAISWARARAAPAAAWS